MYNILFIDDDKSIIYIVKRMKLWGKSNFKIKDTANNGKQALQLIKDNKYDLIITDIRMPMLDGLELLEKMRNNNDETLVCLSSTYNDFEYAKKGIQLDAVDYLLKPINEKDLENLLEKAEIILEKKNLSDIYIEKEKIDKWFFGLFDGKVNEISEGIREECKIKGLDNKACVKMVKYALENIWNKFCVVYPWINDLEIFDFNIKEESVNIQIIKYLNQLKDVIDVFKLGNQDSVINNICNVIVRNMNSTSVIEKIAEELDLTRDHVSKLFKGKVGITLNEYITTIKIEYAKKLLRSTNMRLYEISDCLGYSTVDYFGKLFKTRVSVTPMQYRKNLIT